MPQGRGAWQEPHHSKADVSHFKSRAVVGAVASNCYHLPVGIHGALDDAVNQCVFVSGRGAGENAQSWPNLVE